MFIVVLSASLTNKIDFDTSTDEALARALEKVYLEGKRCPTEPAARPLRERTLPVGMLLTRGYQYTHNPKATEGWNASTVPKSACCEASHTTPTPMTGTNIPHGA